MTRGAAGALADRIVRDIIADLSDRRGLRHEWDQIDEDVQQEIRDKWEALVEKHLQENVRSDAGRIIPTFVPAFGMPLDAAIHAAISERNRLDRDGSGDLLFVFNGAVVTIHGAMTTEDVARLISPQLRLAYPHVMRFIS